MQTLSVFFFCYIGFSLVSGQNFPDFEVSALLAVKSSLVDSSNHLEEWKKPENLTNFDGLSHCKWTGVYCNSRGSVEKLLLSSMNLTGNISDQIQRFRFLQVIDLSNNRFESSLPKSLANLTSLKSFNVSSNNFFGSFPSGLGMASGLRYVNASSNNFSGFLPEDLTNATTLEVLDLRGGYFEGSLPSTIKNLKNLKFLGLSGNSLRGKLPREIGELSSLETMILGYNEFMGEIPEEIGNLTSLQYLDLAVGNLTGQIPHSLGRLNHLTTVYLYKNNLTGKIPQELGSITSLENLDLSNNQISGEIPVELAELKNLQLLNLMQNQLTGVIPEKIGELVNIQVLELWQNSLTGSLPMNLGKNSPLQWLDVSSNKLTGKIPSGLCDFRNLTKLILFNNRFSGLIPEGIFTCQSLVRVRIQNNLISGTIPIGLGSLPLLQHLELAKNNLTGQIPGDIASSASLSFIDLSFNHLSSSLPSSIFSSSNLQTFIASHNNFEGNIPNRFQDCQSLSVLDLSFNHFSGEIPETIAYCEKLVTLNLRNNQLTGEIPKSLAIMHMLAVLDLSNNTLTGNIPENFGASPVLEMFNLSFNKLKGPIPSNGLFAAINPDDLIGNSGLCGGILPPCSQRLSAMADSKKHRRKMSINHVILGLMVGTAVILFLGIMFFIGRWIYRRWDLFKNFLEDSFYLKKPEVHWPWRLIAFQRLNFTAGDILSHIKESNIIGMGATGIVYKAEVMKRPSIIVAVKKLWRSQSHRSNIEDHLEDHLEDQEEDILKEVALLGRLRHRNIVRLLGYIHNEIEIMMVYEFMPNGNLGTALHSNTQKMLLVDWVSRYNVAVGVAQGLNYLHNDCCPPVIHRDIKSNNILLDANLEAKIADFGLAMMMIRKNETVSKVAGSHGYIAPEYGYSMKIDEKSDIYSFGVVLLELITGKEPLDPSFGESIDIVEWIRRKAKNNSSLEQVLDSNIAGECTHVIEEMLLALRIALLCTAKLPKDRPSMRDVIMMLGEAKPRRKSVCYDRGQIYSDRDKPIFSNSPVVGLI